MPSAKRPCASAWARDREGGAIWRPCGPMTHQTAAKLPRQPPARHRNLSYASSLPLSSRVARPWEGRPPSQDKSGACAGEVCWGGASKHPRGGGGRREGCRGAGGCREARGSELVEYRIRSEHFRLAGSMFVSSLPRGSGGAGVLPTSYACGVCAVRGVLWPFVSGVSRGLAANAHSSLPLLWHRHARCCLSPGEGQRTAAAVCTSAFWTFWSSCTAVMHGPRVRSGLRVGAGGVVEECWRRCDGRRGAHWRRRRGRTSGDATRAATRLHRCACEARGWGISRGGGARAR